MFKPQFLYDIRTDFWSAAFKNQRDIGQSLDGVYNILSDREFAVMWFSGGEI